MRDREPDVEPVAGYELNVFINCPFDKEYYSLLRPLLFTVVYLGYNPRIAYFGRRYKGPQQ